MNVIKILESLVKVRQELEETTRKMAYLKDELDLHTSNMIEFLKDKRIIETRTI